MKVVSAIVVTVLSGAAFALCEPAEGGDLGNRVAASEVNLSTPEVLHFLAFGSDPEDRIAKRLGFYSRADLDFLSRAMGKDTAREQNNQASVKACRSSRARLARHASSSAAGGRESSPQPLEPVGLSNGLFQRPFRLLPQFFFILQGELAKFLDR
jgi:hypothetical protein